MMMWSMEEYQEAVGRDTTTRFRILVEYLTCLQRMRGMLIIDLFYPAPPPPPPPTFDRCSASALRTASCCFCSSSVRLSYVCLRRTRSATPRSTTELATSRFILSRNWGKYIKSRMLHQYSPLSYLTNSSRSLCTVARFLTSLRRASCN